MIAAGIPYKFTLPWAKNAGGAYIQNPIPSTTATPGRASFDQGYPAVTFTPVSAGGIPPFGADTNGILFALSAWAQWQQAGGAVPWDSSFASGISGYPLGAIVANATVNGFFWLNGTDGNTTNPDAGGAGWTGFQVGVFPATGAQLQYSSATQLLLAPKSGGFLWINGFNYAVPANLVLSNSGFSASTLYFIYAKISGGVMVLDKSTTGYTLASNGMPQKAGDATQTCVGMVYIDNAGHFINSDGYVGSNAGWLVSSYFQRQLVRCRANLTVDVVSSAGLAEISSALRCSFVVWAGEQVQFSISGNAVAASTSGTAMDFDGGSAEVEGSALNGTGGIGFGGVKTGLSEGLHYGTLFGGISGGGNVTWKGGSATTAALAPTTLTIALMQ